jgi:hypothetical protein
VFPLTDGTRARVHALFPAGDWATVESLLIERCGSNLPLVNDWPQLVERIRYAVLKLSAGRISELGRHLDVACTDWRDVLVAAGFGDDSRVHLAWFPQ